MFLAVFLRARLGAREIVNDVPKQMHILRSWSSLFTLDYGTLCFNLFYGKDWDTTLTVVVDFIYLIVYSAVLKFDNILRQV